MRRGRDAGPHDAVHAALRRPPAVAASATPAQGRLRLQLLDIKVTDEPPIEVSGYEPTQMASDRFLHCVPRRAPPQSTACTVLLFAVDECGRSALVRVSGFRPHLTYEVRSPSARNQLLEKLRERTRCDDLQTSSHSLRRLYDWVPDMEDPTKPRQHACVRVLFPTLAALREASRAGAIAGCAPWEGKVDAAMMFFDATSLKPCCWFEVESPREAEVNGATRVSHCSIEISCGSVSLLHPLPDRVDMAPMLVASVDIECVSSTGGFPDASLPGDRVVIVCTSFWRVGRPLEETVSVVQCVGESVSPLFSQSEGEPPPGQHFVECFASESALLNAWRDLIAVRADPDIVVGYNTFGFDYPYLAARGKASSRFRFSGRLIAEESKPFTKELQSNALGQADMSLLGWSGRVDVDVLRYVRAEHKMQVYKLDAVAEHFLGERKVDLPVEQLFRCLREGTPDGLSLACSYCLQDTLLPLRLCKRLEILPSMVEMSRVTCTSLNQLTLRGQQIKVFNQLVWHAHRMGYVLNDPVSHEDQGYQGAIVIEPTPGFYTTPVATLDFSSLYPSILLAHNLCFSTFVRDPKFMGLQGVTYETHRPATNRCHTFVTSTPGVLPSIIRELLAARKRAKREMASAESPELKALYNARQLALKVSCNSVYGFTGAAKRGMYPNVAIADSVTCKGREMIEKTSRLVREFMPCDVIYGDTDSVMLRFHDAALTAQTAFELGERAAAHVSSQFHEDVTLEMEKVYLPYLLLGKKRYVGLMHTPNKKGQVVFEKMDAKGVELVRRDNCPFAKRVYAQVLEPIMHQCDPARAVDNLRANVAELVHDEVPLEQFVLTKQMKKRESYANQLQPHLVVCEKIGRAKPGAEPLPGDRVPFYIAEPRRGAAPLKVSERAEDPTMGRESGLPPDRLYYLQHQVVNPVTTLFTAFAQGVRDEVEAILSSGANTLSLQQQRQSSIRSFFSAAPPSVAPLEEASEAPTDADAGEANGAGSGSLWEALGSLGGSSGDARVVRNRRSYSKRARKAAAPLQPRAAAPSLVGEIVREEA